MPLAAQIVVIVLAMVGALAILKQLVEWAVDLEDYLRERKRRCPECQRRKETS